MLEAMDKCTVLLFGISFNIFWGQITNADSECERIDFDLYIHRGSTTDYDQDRISGNFTNKHCQPRQIWSMIRHGIRSTNPISHRRINSLKELKLDIMRSQENGQGRMCADDVKYFKYWEFDQTLLNENKFLTNRGRNELLTIGKRMRTHFPELLEKPYDSDLYYFASSSHQRTIQSLRAFTDGFFEGDPLFNSYYINDVSPVAEYDCVVDFAATIEHDYDLYPPIDEFVQTSNLYERVGQSLFERTGLPRGTFNKTIILALYEACTYETPRDSRLSPWCRVFRLEDLELLKNREEIFHYVLASYGWNDWHKFNCLQTNDLISLFNDTVHNKTDGFVMKSFFTHDAYIEKMLVKMGCFWDPLITTNYGEFDRNHIWDISTLTPFGSNILAVLYSCGDSVDDYELQFYLNEIPIGCCMTNSTDACSWNEFRDRMQDFASSCEEDICEDLPNSSAKHLTFNKILSFSSITLNIVLFMWIVYI